MLFTNKNVTNDPLILDCEYPNFNNDTVPQGSQNPGQGAELTVRCKHPGFFFAQEEHYMADATPGGAGVVMTCNRSNWDVRSTPNCERKC